MQIKFKAKTTHGIIYDRVLCGNTKTDDPCSSVYENGLNKWLHFDKSCGQINQYTGLKTNSNKEIYLNDDVQYTRILYGWYEEITENHKVVFQNGAFGIVLHDEFISFAELINHHKITLEHDRMLEIELVEAL